MDGSERLTVTQLQAVAALVVSRTVVEAAQSVGCGESTLRRWLGDPGFRDAYREAARSAAAGAMSAVLSAQVEAVETLRSELRGQSPAQRVRAARALLEVGARALEWDTNARLEEIERRVKSWDERRAGTLGPLGLTG